jgi:hypothetical protein
MGPAVDAYATLYVPQADVAFSRVSITGSLFQIEFSNRDWSSSTARSKAERMKESDIRGAMIQAMNLMGISPIDVPYERAIVKPQAYAKILPVDEAIRKRFIIWASEEHRVYSLGRFATWRPGLLLDDVVNDVRVIQRLMGGSSRYDHTK